MSCFQFHIIFLTTYVRFSINQTDTVLYYIKPGDCLFYFNTSGSDSTAYYSVMRTVRSVSCETTIAHYSAVRITRSIRFGSSACRYSATRVVRSMDCVASVAHYSATHVVRSTICYVTLLYHSVTLKISDLSGNVNEAASSKHATILSQYNSSYLYEPTCVSNINKVKLWFLLL